MADERVGILLDAKDNATRTIGNVKNSLNSLSKEASGVDSVTSAFAGLSKAAGLVGVAVGALQLSSAVVELAQVGAQAQRVEDSFRILSQQAGIAADDFLASMQRASQGTIANSELMLTANRALALGVADSSAEISQLLQVAIARGKALGLSATVAFNDLVTGIGRISPLILDNLGIVTGGEKVFNDYAASIGKSTAALTDQERKQALVNKVIAESKDLVNANARSGLDTAASFERMDAAIQNAKVALGELFSPAVAVIAQSIANAAIVATDAIQEFGDSGKASLDTLAEQFQDTRDRYDDLKSLVESTDFSQPAFVPPQLQQQGIATEADATARLNQLKSELTTINREYLATALKLYPAEAKNADSLNRTSIEAMNAANAMRIAATEARALAIVETPSFAQIDYGTFVSDTQTLVKELSLGTITVAEFAQLLNALSSGTTTYSAQAGNAVTQIQLLTQGFIDGSVSEEQLRSGMEKLTGVTFGLQSAIGALAATYPAASQNALQLAEANEIAADRIRKVTSALGSSLTAIAGEVAVSSGPEEAFKFLKQANSELETMQAQWAATGVSTQEAEVLAYAYQRQVRKAAEETYNFGSAATRATQSAKTELKALNAEFENIKSNASGILTDAINDIGGVDLDSILPREDEVNENARRLADIAVNGFKGQNWLEEFKKEVPDIYQALVDSGDPRKTAAQILRDFQDGLRPELLDKSKAKELVKRAIIGDQNLSAIADEIAREVATELGVSLEQAQSAAATALGTSGGKDAEKKITITPTIDRSGLINQDVVLTATVTDVEFGKDVSTKIEYIATVTEITIDPAVNRPILAAQMTINDIVIPPEVKPPDVVIAGGMTINDVVLRSDVAIPDVEIVGTVIVTPPDTTPITSQVLLLSSQVTSITLADSVALPILAAQMVIDAIVIGAGVQPPVPSIAGGMTITDVLLRSDADIPEVNLTATTTVTPIDVKAIESTIINVPVNLVIPEIDLSATVTIVEPDTAQITGTPLVYSAVVSTATLADNVETPPLTAPLVVSGVTLPVNTEIPKPSLTSSMAIDTVSILPSAVLPTVNLAANADVRPIDPLAISALEATPVNLDATVNLPDVNLNSTVTVTPPDTSLITSTILTIPAQVSEVTLAKDATFPQPSSTMMINEYMIAPGLLPPTPEITTDVTVNTVSLADSVVLPEVTLESTVSVTPPDTSGITATTLVIPAQVNDVTLSSSAVLPQPVSSMTISEYILASGIVPPLPQITSSVVVDTVTLADNVTLPQVPLVPASVGNTAETDTETALFDLQNRLTPVVIPQIDYLAIPVEQLEAAGIWIMTGISTGITNYNIGNAIVTELYKAQTVLTEAGVSNGKTWGAGFGSGASEYITAIVATVVSLALQKIGREGTRTGAQ